MPGHFISNKHCCTNNLASGPWTFRGVTTIGAGRAVALPLFDESKYKNLKLTIEWPTTASNVSSHYRSAAPVESVYINVPVADLEGVPWVPWNPIFEGLS